MKAGKFTEKKNGYLNVSDKVYIVLVICNISFVKQNVAKMNLIQPRKTQNT